MILIVCRYQCYYKILGVIPGASPEEIRNAYLHLVKKFHPDKSRITHNMFIEVQNAWDILGNPVRKQNIIAKSK